MQGRGLTGKGVKVGVWDAPVDRHIDIAARLHQIEMEEMAAAADAPDHGIHVATTVGGAGLLDPKARGMAPSAELYTHNFGEQSNG